MIQVNRIYLIFNRLVTKKFLVDTSVFLYIMTISVAYPFPHSHGKGRVHTFVSEQTAAPESIRFQAFIPLIRTALCIGGQA